MAFIETEHDTSLYYNDWGAGRPVVFVHGWALGADMWEYQASQLAGKGLRCIAYDKRGCGRSAQPGHGYDADTLADDLAALIAQLDLRDVTLVAHSMGSGDVARYLSRHGADRVSRAMLVATTLPFIQKTPDNPDGVDKGVYDEMVAGLREDRPHYLAMIAPGFFGVNGATSSVSSEMVDWGVGLALRASPQATIDLLRSMSETDHRLDIDAFTVPTLIVHGAGDQIAPIDLTARKTAQAIPASRLEVYDTASHGLPITDKERLNRDLLRFVEN